MENLSAAEIIFLDTLSPSQKVEAVAYLVGRVYGVRIEKPPARPRIERVRDKIVKGKFPVSIRVNMLALLVDLERLFNEAHEFADSYLEQFDRTRSIQENLRRRIEELEKRVEPISEFATSEAP